MLDPKVEQECRKILTYGMCLELVDNVSTAVRQRQDAPRSAKTTNRNYTTFIKHLQQKGV